MPVVPAGCAFCGILTNAPADGCESAWQAGALAHTNSLVDASKTGIISTTSQTGGGFCSKPRRAGEIRKWATATQASQLLLGIIWREFISGRAERAEEKGLGD